MMVTVKNQSWKEVSEAWSRFPPGRAAFGTSGQAGLAQDGQRVQKMPDRSEPRLLSQTVKL